MPQLESPKVAACEDGANRRFAELDIGVATVPLHDFDLARLGDSYIPTHDWVVRQLCVQLQAEITGVLEKRDL